MNSSKVIITLSLLVIVVMRCGNCMVKRTSNHPCQFGTYDINGDGSVDTTEVDIAVQTQSQLIQDYAGIAFDIMDTNDDNVVKEDEFNAEIPMLESFGVC